MYLLDRSRREELDGEIFEILITFEDFLEFKQLMLSYRAVSTFEDRLETLINFFFDFYIVKGRKMY
jgi:hypothetical protein